MPKQKTLSKQVLYRVPAIEIRQSPQRTLYSFAIDGKKLAAIATISRIRREAAGDLFGYQRPEVVSHIGEIRRYLESANPIIPNALVVAFDERVRFEPFEDSPFETEYSRAGILIIPVDSEAPDEEKPGWIVDGQQRAAAIREANIPSFPICITGFIAANAQEQREQFILVNSTKPLPKGLIYELLPQTESTLPTLLQKRRFPSKLLSRLNADEDSPLRGMIETPTTLGGVVKDNTILRLLENSLSDGMLYRLRCEAGSENAAIETMLKVLKAFMRATRETFPDAWGLPPRRSRLMHGAGMVSLGFLMDAIADRHRKHLPTTGDFCRNLEPLVPVCRWTTGYWDFGPVLQRKWNEVQNTSKDTQLLANYLLIQYRMLVWDRGRTNDGAAKRS